MSFLSLETGNIPLILCGAFYSLLCVFSIVTGLIYMSGKRELNPLELSDGFVAKLNSPGRLHKFTVFMGFVTFAVGLVQGITAFGLFAANSPIYYWIALGFTLFSIVSVTLKLRGKINAFPLLKAVAYVMILIVLLLASSRTLFFR